MRKISKLLLMVCSLALASSCAWLRTPAPSNSPATAAPTPRSTATTAPVSPVANWTVVTPEKAREIIQSTPNTLIIDVRSAQEYAAKHLANAINIPTDQVVQNVNSMGIDKNTPILTYCKSGIDASYAAQMLTNAGYPNVANIGSFLNSNFESVDNISPANVVQTQTPMPDFTLPMTDGSQFTLSQQKGKVVVLNFWATWCPPCRQEIPEFLRLNDEFKRRGDVQLLCINMTDGQRDTRHKVNAFLSQNGYTSLPVAYEEGGSVSNQLGISSLPTTVVVDTQGNISDFVLGQTNYDKIISMVEAAKK